MTTFPFKSMREWLSFIDKKDELLHITDEIDLRTDITGVHHFLSDEAKWGKNSPAVIFENIKGYPGWRLTTCSFLTPQRRAWIMGAPLERKEFASYVSPKLDQHVPPMEISDGPCKELKFFGDEVDLTKLPIPFSGDVSLEGTPSITAGISNKLDPELNWQNVAIRRYGLKGKRTLSEFISPVQQDFGIWGRYRRMKQPTPVAIVITSDPLTYMINLAKAPVGFCEYDLWGVFAGTPLEVVRCETSDLVVPANAEIIIEGELHHNIREMDGPCPEYCGYYTAIAEVGHVDVKCVTMRNDPIFYYLIMGMPPNEAICIQGLMTEMSVYRELVKLFPGVLDVSFDFHNIIGVVKVDKRIAKAWPGIARYIANAVKNIYSPKWMFIVDEDMRDITDPYQLFNMMISKFQGSRDITIIPRMQGSVLDPSEPWAGSWGWSDFTIVDLTEPPPPFDAGYERGVGLPSDNIIEKGKNILKNIGYLKD